MHPAQSLPTVPLTQESISKIHLYQNTLVPHAPTCECHRSKNAQSNIYTIKCKKNPSKNSHIVYLTILINPNFVAI